MESDGDVRLQVTNVKYGCLRCQVGGLDLFPFGQDHVRPSFIGLRVLWDLDSFVCFFILLFS
jgi:hypothetical protein